MSTKHFCDACEDELTPENRLSRSHTIEHKFEELDPNVTFVFTTSYSSDANGARQVVGDGHICEPCFHSALLTYLQTVGGVPEEDDGSSDVADAFEAADDHEDNEEETPDDEEEEED